MEIILHLQLTRLPDCLRGCVGKKKGVKNFELNNWKGGVITDVGKLLRIPE